MAEVKKFQSDGKEAGKVALPESVFDSYVRVQTVQQSLLRQLGNARRANPRTLTKGDVSGRGGRPWRQKGTGRARQGSTRNPHWRGGGVAHGPDGRNYTTQMNKKERRKALCSVLTLGARREKISVLADPAFEAPRTRRVVDMIKAMGFDGQKVLFVTPARDEAFERSVRNLPRCKTLLYSNLNPHDLLHHDQVVVFEKAVEKIVTQLTAPARPSEVVNAVNVGTGTEEAQS